MFEKLLILFSKYRITFWCYLVFWLQRNKFGKFSDQIWKCQIASKKFIVHHFEVLNVKQWKQTPSLSLYRIALNARRVTKFETCQNHFVEKFQDSNKCTGSSSHLVVLGLHPSFRNGNGLVGATKSNWYS